MTNRTHVIILEDEPPAADRLSTLVRSIDPSVSVDGVFESVKSASVWLSEHPEPDLAFLDIQLADGLSFELLERGTLHAPVIFVTAYDEYAVRAFKVNSIDYLLKPVDPKELKRSLAKFHETRPGTVDLRSILGAIRERRPSYRTRFLIPHADRYIAVETGSILYFSTEKKKTILTLADGTKHETGESLEELEEELDPATFFRANRQYLVSYGSISGIHAYFNGKLSVYLKKLQESLIISKERAGEFKQWLNR